MKRNGFVFASLYACILENCGDDMQLEKTSICYFAADGECQHLPAELLKCIGLSVRGYKADVSWGLIPKFLLAFLRWCKNATMLKEGLQVDNAAQEFKIQGGAAFACPKLFCSCL